MSESTRKLHILLVEDDRLTRTVIRDQMRACGYSVTTAENGETALKLLRSNKGRLAFDLVVTDVRMPKVNGAQLIDQMRLHDNMKRIPVVVISSNDAAEDVAQLLAAGAVEYLIKPVLRSRLEGLQRHKSALPPQAGVAQHGLKETLSNQLKSSGKAAGLSAVGSLPDVAHLTTSPPLTVCSGDSQDTRSGAIGGSTSQALLGAVESLLAGREFNGAASNSQPLGNCAEPSATVSAERNGAGAGTDAETSAAAKVCADVKPDDKEGAFGAANVGAPISTREAPLQQAPLGPFQMYRTGMLQTIQEAGGKLVLCAAGGSSQGPNATTAVGYPLYIAQCVPHNGVHRPMMMAVNVAASRQEGRQLEAVQLQGVPHDAALARRLALERFRRKKANRDYTKKVRYEARKKLAEQRPRFKGQFVKMPAQQETTT